MWFQLQQESARVSSSNDGTGMLVAILVVAARRADVEGCRYYRVRGLGVRW